jgi:hypothetical protein
MNDPRNPEIPGCHEIHANAERYEGIASGNEKAIVRKKRPGSPEMVMTQLAKVPMMTLAQVTEAASVRLRIMSERVRSWNSSSMKG